MRKSFVLVPLVALTLFAPHSLMAQTVYPIQGQPQGGDRRGTYVNNDKEAQKEYDEKGTITRLYADPKLYLHNMTLLAHVPGSISMADMMTIGGNRYLVGGGRIVDVTDPKQPVVVNPKAPSGELAFNQSLKKWILMRAESCCMERQDWLQGKAPRPDAEPRRGGRPLGVTFFDVTDPRNVVEISHYQTPVGSNGTHSDGNFYDGGKYAYLAAELAGTRGELPFKSISRILLILDVSDLKNPKEVSQWWVPGQKLTEETEYLKWPEAEPAPKPWSPESINQFTTFHGPCYVPKRVEDGGNRGYCAWSALGMRILDFSDIRQPKLISTLDISPPFTGGEVVHNAYPMLQRKLIFMNGEADYWDCHEGLVRPWVVDVRAEKYPMTIASFPVPKPPAEAPYNDFCFRGGRFGTHHPQNFKAPGELRMDLMSYAWFTGGFRLYDTSDPFRPEEIAWMVPPMGTARGTESAFIEWDRKIIHVFTDTGIYILSTPALGEPVLGPLKPERWNPEGLNAGAP